MNFLGEAHTEAALRLNVAGVPPELLFDSVLTLGSILFARDTSILRYFESDIEKIDDFIWFMSVCCVVFKRIYPVNQHTNRQAHLKRTIKSIESYLAQLLQFKYTVEAASKRVEFIRSKGLSDKLTDNSIGRNYNLN